MVVGVDEVYGDGNMHDVYGGALRMSLVFLTHRGRR
jgi:hypothetical protein